MQFSIILLILSPFFQLFTQSKPHNIRNSHKRSINASPFVDISTLNYSIPITRLHTINSNNQHLHPQVIHQQHINRSLKRLARMTKRDLPTDEELNWKLLKRMQSVEEVSSKRNLKKRQRMSLAGANTKNNVGLNEFLNVAATSSGSGISQVDVNASKDNTVQIATTPTGVNSLGLSIEANDVGYFATIQAGTPPVDFKILMDSGSADFWLSSQACTNCGNHQKLGSKTSSTFVSGTTTFSVTYGTGNVQGTVISDDVNIGGLLLKAHPFGVTTAESAQFGANSIPFDGLMGLAKSLLSEQKVPTPIEALKSAGTVASAQMGYHLARLSDGTNDGEITFGGVDASKFSGKLTEFPNINTAGFWEGTLDDISVNGVSLNLHGRTAILDTGTTLIVAPAADAIAIHAAIPGSASDGQGGFTVPCTLTSSVALSFGQTAFSINPQDIAFLPLDPNNLKGQCTSGISSGTVGGANEWLVGDVFLKNVYFATDIDSNSIGLAPSIAV